MNWIHMWDIHINMGVSCGVQLEVEAEGSERIISLLIQVINHLEGDNSLFEEIVLRVPKIEGDWLWNPRMDLQESSRLRSCITPTRKIFSKMMTIHLVDHGFNLRNCVFSTRPLRVILPTCTMKLIVGSMMEDLQKYIGIWGTTIWGESFKVKWI